MNRDRLHDLLLHLTGRAPDEDLWTARARLASGDLAGALTTLAGALVWDEVPVTPAESGELAALAAEAGDTVLPGTLRRLPAGVAPPMGFWIDPGPGADPGADLTVGAAPDPGPVEAALIAAAAELPGALGLWHAWRFPIAPQGGDPVRVVLLEAGQDGDPVALTGLLQAELAITCALTGSELTASVGVYRTGTPLPPHHEAVLAAGVLLWARDPAPGFLTVETFDPVPAGPDAAPGPPWFAPDRPRLDGAERERVVAYLASGVPLLTPEDPDDLDEDVLDPDRPPRVPGGWRTDGRLVWSEATTYYAREHGTAPREPLLSTALAPASPTSRPDGGVAVFRALGHAVPPGLREPVLILTTLPDGLPGAGSPGEELPGAGLPAGVRLAQVFDHLDGGSPGFAPDRPRMPDDADAAWVLEYLESGHPLPSSPAGPAPDVLAPGLGPVVPAGMRTDGAWVWPAAAAHYLREHRIAPDPDLVEHIRGSGYLLPGIDDGAVGDVLARWAESRPLRVGDHDAE